MAVCTTYGPPRLILLLRHAEKPTDTKDPNLSTRGYSRAGALPAWLISAFGKPVAVYAMKSGEAGAAGTLSGTERFVRSNSTRAATSGLAKGGEHKTHRPVQTVTPLATALGMTVKTPYGYDDIQPLVHELLTTPEYAAKIVVVCWVHGEIKTIAKQLGYEQAKDWDGDDYDHVWAITPTASATLGLDTSDSVTLKVVPQRLLFGDASK